MARFLLVHGAWHGGWCFAGLAEALRRRGHEVSAPDLPIDRAGLGPRDYAGLLDADPPTIAVGHSLGAQTVGLLETDRRVYLAGVLPVVERMSEAFAAGFGGFVRDEQGRSYWPDADTAAERLYPDCTRTQVDRAFARLRPQAPFEPVVAGLRKTDVVVAARRDACLDPGWQTRTAHAHGAVLVELDAGHFPFVTHPEVVADLLDGLSRA